MNNVWLPRETLSQGEKTIMKKQITADGASS